MKNKNNGWVYLCTAGKISRNLVSPVCLRIEVGGIVNGFKKIYSMIETDW